MKSILGFGSFLLLSLTGSVSLSQQVTFTEVATSMGINHQYHNNYFGGGVSFCDFNADGLEDLSVSSGTGSLIFLLENEITAFSNLTSQLNVMDQLESETVLWVDFDNDADKDLFLTNRNGANRLYRNDGFVFSDISAISGIQNPVNGVAADSIPSTAACLADYDNDGFIDLFVANQPTTIRNCLYRNNGDGTFTDVTVAAGLADVNKNPLAAAFLDINNDGWQDLCVGNDRLTGNLLYRNDGDGTFTDISQSSGTDADMYAMGIAVGDYDDDGDLDFYVSNSRAGNRFFKNNGDETFDEVAGQLGAVVFKDCWGVNFLDYDNDTDLDLFVSVSSSATDRSNVLLGNTNGSFSAVNGIGIEDALKSHGSAIGDFDNNGYCDIAVVNASLDPADSSNLFSLLKSSGGPNNWLKLELEGFWSNRDAVGSLVEVFIGGIRLVRSTHCGISYLSQDSPVLLVGIGPAALIDSVAVHWPGPIFTRDVVYNITPNQTIHLLEGQGIVSDIEPRTVIPASLELHQNFPNPFNPSTTIGFSLPQTEKIRLTVYNALGQKVRTLLDRTVNAGHHVVKWDGSDDLGNRVSSGLYVYRIAVRTGIRSRKMLLIR